MLTSTANARVKSVARLRERRHRDRTGRFVIEGRRELAAAASGGWPVETVFYCESLFAGRGERELIERLAGQGAVCEAASAAVFGKMSYRHTPDGLLAVAETPGCALADLPAADAGLWLVAARIEKPGNLGAMLRSADAAGAAGVLLADARTDPFNPNVVRASVGALFTVPLAVDDAAAVRAWLAARSIRILAASPVGARAYYEADFSGAAALVIGSEDAGLDAEWLAAGDAVRIPMAGRADSVNAATAAAVLLFEARRQRGLIDSPRCASASRARDAGAGAGAGEGTGTGEG